jgi:hypothetical protein
LNDPAVTASEPAAISSLIPAIAASAEERLAEVRPYSVVVHKPPLIPRLYSLADEVKVTRVGHEGHDIATCIEMGPF